MSKVYKVTENQFKTISKNHKSKNIDEALTEDSDIFEVSLNGQSIDDYFDNKKIFKAFSFEHGEISIDGIPYDLTIDCESARIKYKIDVNYRHYGIDSITIDPIQIIINGVISLIGDQHENTKDFEIAYNSEGLISNTFSGSFPMDINFAIPEISKSVVFKTQFNSEIHQERLGSIYIDSVDIHISDNISNITFNY